MSFLFANKSSEIKPPIYSIALLFLFFCAASLLRFYQWEPTHFFGDDLFNYMFNHGDRFDEPISAAIFSDRSVRFRFVFTWLYQVEVLLFDKNLYAYLAVNIIIHALCGLVLSSISYYFCRSRVVAILLGTIGVTSQFGLIAVTQVIGQVESLPLLFCLLAIYSVIKASPDNLGTEGQFKSSWKWAALLFAFLAFNSHERYIVVLPWLCLFFVLHPKAGKIKDRALFTLASIAIVVVNVLVKLLVYKSVIFQGTAGQPLSINLDSMRTLLTEALMSIVGLNHGPDYLIAIDWTEFDLITMSASIALACISACFLAASFKKSKSATTPIHWPLALLLLMAMLLIPPILTIRMEQRWELGPFFLFLIIFAIGLNRIGEMRYGKAIRIVMMTIFVVSTAITQFTISNNASNIYITREDSFGSAVKRVVIDGKASPPGSFVIFVAHGSGCTFALTYGGFFDIYEGKHRKIKCVATLSEVSPADYPPETKVFLEESPDVLTDVTDKWRSQEK